LFEHSLSIAIAAVPPAHFSFRIHSAPWMEPSSLLDRLKESGISAPRLQRGCALKLKWDKIRRVTVG